MKIAITGGTGFLGRHLSTYLLALGHEMVLIQRSDLMEGSDQVSKLIKSTDVIINLAGSPVIKRWTASNKIEIVSSRLNTTNLLVDTLTRLNPQERPSLFLSASAIGIYDSVNVHKESSVDYDVNFLATVCQQWEKSLEPLKKTNVRVCVMRIGIVLGEDGGMMKQLIPLFKAGLGGKIGSGRQGFSFIHHLDFCRGVEYLMVHNQCTGIFNMTAPEFSTNALFTQILAKGYQRPAFFTVPAIALKLIYGEAAVALLKGQSVYPQHLLDSGFEFVYPDIGTAVLAVLSKNG